MFVLSVLDVIHAVIVAFMSWSRCNISSVKGHANCFSIQTIDVIYFDVDRQSLADFIYKEVVSNSVFRDRNYRGIEQVCNERLLDFHRKFTMSSGLQ